MHFQNVESDGDAIQVADSLTRKGERERGRRLEIYNLQTLENFSFNRVYIQVIVSGLNTHLRDFDA